VAKLLKISGITSKNGRNDAEWLDVNVVTVSDEAKPEKLKMQRKAESSRSTVCKSLETQRSVCAIKEYENGRFDFKIDRVSHVSRFRKEMN